MKNILLVLSFTLLASVAFAASGFNKVQSREPVRNILQEGKTSVISSEMSLQPIRERSLESMRVLLGSATNTTSVGPQIAAEWSTKISLQNPLFASAGISYLIETKTNDDGNVRNFHQIPIYLNLGYSIRLFKSFRATAAAGPALRQTFERGNSIEQNRSGAYGDLIANLGADYEWFNSITNSGKSFGIRVSRLFGLPNSRQAAPVDSAMASFGFDL